jgi:parallel beta-helix repeat protein
MNPIRNLALSCLALVVLVVLSGQAFASNSVTVGLCAGPGTHYLTIQAAVNAVSIGGTVRVCPGPYPEQVTISKNLALTGIANGTADAAVVTVPSGGLVTNGVVDIFGFPTAAQIFVQNANVTVSHITVDGANDGLTDCSIDAIGIYYQNSSGIITDNAVRNVLLPTGLQGCQDGLAINVEGSTGTPAVTISDNSVRNYDKNGITASGPGTAGVGPVVTVKGNTVIGLGATTVTAQNGIQVGLGATGSITSNYVADDIYTNPPNCSPSCTGASGILVYASAGVTVSSNTVESAQYGIVPVTDTNNGGPANGTIIKLNHIGGTQLFDAIDLCSDGNTAQTNVIYGSSQDGIHMDDSCSPSTGSNNTVTGNTINEACAGILLGSGTGNTTAPNTFLNVTNTTLAGDVCTPAVGPIANGMQSGATKHLSLRPSPLKPNRN